MMNLKRQWIAASRWEMDRRLYWWFQRCRFSRLISSTFTRSSGKPRFECWGVAEFGSDETNQLKDFGGVASVQFVNPQQDSVLRGLRKTLEKMSWTAFNSIHSFLNFAVDLIPFAGQPIVWQERARHRWNRCIQLTDERSAWYGDEILLLDELLSKMCFPTPGGPSRMMLLTENFLENFFFGHLTWNRQESMVPVPNTAYLQHLTLVKANLWPWNPEYLVRFIFFNC